MAATPPLMAPAEPRRIPISTSRIRLPPNESVDFRRREGGTRDDFVPVWCRRRESDRKPERVIHPTVARGILPIQLGINPNY